MAKGMQANVRLSANTEAIDHIDEAVRAFTLNYGDANAFLALAREADPGWRDGRSHAGLAADLIQ